VKKDIFIVLLSCTFLLTGCGRGDASVLPIPENSHDKGTGVYAEEVGETKVDEEAVGTSREDLPTPTEGAASNNDFTMEPPESGASKLQVLVNTQEEEIFFVREDNIDPLRAIHRCVSDGQNIYLAYNETDLYVMPVGADSHSRANIDNPEKLMVCNVAVDTYGALHLLMATPEYEDWFIWCLDENYSTEKIMDVSAYFKTKRIPLWFLVDKDGTYYMQWALDRNGVILDKDGSLKYETTPQSLGLSWIYEAAVGKDGQIYLLYQNAGGKLGIAGLDTQTGIMGAEEMAFSFPDDETFSLMAAGTDTTLLLFSPYSGAWACDMEKGILANRATLSDIGFSQSMEYWPLTFVPDGRLLVMAQFADEELLMKYIPAGK